MTPILDIQNLTKTIGSLELFNNISFSVSEGQHVGLIARNGTGKSTLLNILHGDEDYDSGNIIFRRDITVGYLEQSPRYEAGMSVIDACFKPENYPHSSAAMNNVSPLRAILDLSSLLKKWNVVRHGISSNAPNKF